MPKKWLLSKVCIQNVFFQKQLLCDLGGFGENSGKSTWEVNTLDTIVRKLKIH